MGLGRVAPRRERFSRSAGDGPVTVSKAITGSVRVTLLPGGSGKVEVQGRNGYETRWEFTSLDAAAVTADAHYWAAYVPDKAWDREELQASRVAAAVLTLAAHRGAIRPHLQRYWKAWDLAELRRHVLLQ